MKTITSLFSFVLIIVVSLFSRNAHAQNWPGIRDSVYSDVLKEKRRIQVILPKDYNKDSGKTYEVLYVLDGEWYMEQIPFIYNFVMNSGYASPNIFVLIPNTYVNNVNLRDRDFSPTRINDEQHLGGADNFHAFLKNELIPYVEKKYPTNGLRSLVGSSFSGLFAVYAFIKEPKLFKSYVASDPNLNWDNGYVSKLAGEQLENFTDVTSTLFIAGLEHTFGGMGIAAMDSVLKTTAPPSLHWKCLPYKDETHYSVQHKAFYDGFRFSHFGYSAKAPEFHPMSGMLEKDKSIRLFILNENPAARYTMDGSEVSPSSPVLKRNDLVTISAPSVIKVKSFSHRKEYEQSVQATYKVGTIPSGKERSKRSRAVELRYSYFEGEWKEMPDFKKMKAVQSGIIGPDFNINGLTKSSAAYRIEGNFEAQEDANYIFAISADGGSRLFVGGQLLMDSNVSNYKGIQSYVVSLKKGIYPIDLQLIKKQGDDMRFLVMQSKSENDRWWENQILKF